MQDGNFVFFLLRFYGFFNKNVFTPAIFFRCVPRLIQKLPGHVYVPVRAWVQQLLIYIVVTIITAIFDASHTVRLPVQPLSFFNIYLPILKISIQVLMTQRIIFCNCKEKSLGFKLYVNWNKWRRYCLPPCTWNDEYESTEVNISCTVYITWYVMNMNESQRPLNRK